MKHYWSILQLVQYNMIWIWIFLSQNVDLIDIRSFERKFMMTYVLFLYSYFLLCWPSEIQTLSDSRLQKLYIFKDIVYNLFFIRTVCRHHRRKTHWLGGSLCCLAAHHYQSLSVRERKKLTQLNKRPVASANWDRNFTIGKLIVCATTIWKHTKWYSCFIICWTAQYYALNIMPVVSTAWHWERS